MTDARTDGLAILAAEQVAPRPWLLVNHLSPLVADLVDERLSATGHAVLVDLHSCPRQALPYERHQDARRPPVCLGVDVDHTPAALVERVSSACSVIGQVVVNEPFAGSYVPLCHFGRDNRVTSVMDNRVTSVMVELRRDMYLRDDGNLDPAGARRVSDALATGSSREMGRMPARVRRRPGSSREENASMKLKLDLHDIHNQGAEIDRALRAIIDEAVAKKAPLVEIIPGKGSGALKKHVLRFLDQKEIKALYHRVEKDSDNFGRVFVHFRWK
ncbi:MAG: N-formylglutamate amidohydrolase [Dermatophilaceae bacterium]